MRRVACEYEAPARFDDLIEVFIRTAAIGRTLVALEYRPCTSASPATLLALAEQVMVLIDRGRAAADAGARRHGATPSRPSRAAREHRTTRCRRSSTAARRPTRSCARRWPPCTRASARPGARSRSSRSARWSSGPLIGTAPDDSPAPALAVPIVYRGDTVAALWFGGTTPRRRSRPSSRASRRCSPRTASSAGTPAARSGCRETLELNERGRLAMAGARPRSPLADVLDPVLPAAARSALHRGALELGDLAREPGGIVDAGELEVEVVAGGGVEVDEADAEHALEEALVGLDVLQALVRRRVVGAREDAVADVDALVRDGVVRVDALQPAGEQHEQQQDDRQRARATSGTRRALVDAGDDLARRRPARAPACPT